MPSPHLTRRAFLGGLTVMGAAALSGCTTATRAAVDSANSPPGSSAAGRAMGTGSTQQLDLRAAATDVDLAGTVVATWAYGGALPGPLIRARVGDRLRVTVDNALPEPTSVHWHGLAIDNAMDGVPGLTTPEIAPGEAFTYDFLLPHAGTHWFHPHHGLQLDRGLYGALIIDEVNEPGSYDHEWVLVVDDWTDGLDRSPEEHLADLRAEAARSGGMGMGMGSGMHQVSAGDVDYLLYLVNGRPSDDPDVLRARPGDRVRLRVVNAAADTVVDVAVTGHTMTLTHTDGYRLQPAEANSVRLGMGERFDALVTLSDGAFAFVASPVGKPGLARALVRTGDGTPPPPDQRPAEMASTPLSLHSLPAASGSALTAAEPTITFDVALAGPFPGYIWAINNEAWPDVTPLQVRAGDVARLRLANHSMMPHPVHLHGHTAQVGPGGGVGPRKDTVLLPPMSRLDLTMHADNPGQWLLHCHNAYHAEAGMMTRLDYATS